MANQGIKLSTLSEMSPEERAKTIAEIVKRGSRASNGQTVVLDQRIREFEMRYEMTSAELHQRLRDGSQRETADIAKWLFLLDTRRDATS